MQLSDTKDINAFTAKLGLTLNESQVYFYLLKNGLMFGADIFVQMGMDKSSCYRAIKALRQQGLVYSVGEERNQKFGASHPDMLFGLVDKQKQELQETELKLNSFIDELKNNLSGHYLKKNISVIEGEDGYKLYLEDRLRCKDRYIRDLSGRKAAAPHFEDYDKYMKEYIDRRVRAGIWLNQLVPFGEIDNKWERSSKLMLKEARELPDGFKAEAVFSTWDDKTGFFSKESNSIIGFIVKDSLITNLMNSMFDLIWGMSK